MKLINYQLQSEIETLSSNKPQEYFKAFIKSIIEDTTKPYHKRADYIGLSLLELKEKIDSLSSDIQELQQLKKRLTESLELAKEITAEVFEDNGIDRIDGNIISSLTISKPTTKTKTNINILDTNSVMSLGYIKYEVDREAIEKAIETQEGLEELKEYIAIDTEEITIPSKVKVNSKKASNRTLEELQHIQDVEPIQAIDVNVA